MRANCAKKYKFVFSKFEKAVILGNKAICILGAEVSKNSILKYEAI